MRNSVFRDFDFKAMEDYLHYGGEKPVADFFKYHFACDRIGDCRYYCYPHNDYIIVYLEDYQITEEGEYKLLLDFFTLHDYTSFINVFRGAVESNRRDDDALSTIIPRSTFFQIENYKHLEGLKRKSHYYLNLWGLEERLSTITSGREEGFPLLFNIRLGRRNKRGGQKGAPLLYLTDDLIYPQWVFSSLQNAIVLPEIQAFKYAQLKVWNVDQGNFNEVTFDKKTCVIYDAGTEIYGGTMPFCTLLKKLQDELDKNVLPLFVLSHWHTDHYSLLFALRNNYLEKIEKCVFPSYVKNLSVYNFIVRLKMLGVDVKMVYMPFVDAWMKVAGNDNFRLYANKYYHSNPNNSGLNLFVCGKTNNAMLPGDCRYALAEAQTNDSILYEMGESRAHYLVVPHHCGDAGKVTYRIKNASKVNGIVSVGENTHGHPNETVLKQLKTFVPEVKLTMNEADRNGRDCIWVKL